MGRKPQSAVRFDDSTVARLDALLVPLSSVGHDATMSDVIRAAVLTGLPLLEKAHGVKPAVSMVDPMRARGEGGK